MTTTPNTISLDLIEELEGTLSRSNLPRRTHTLRQITDLFLSNSVNYSDEQITLFDDVFQILVRNIEISAKAQLSKRLAMDPAAPPRIVHALAFDDLVSIAAPVLTHSERLGDDALIENARSKSRDHLLAISKRKTLSGAVTDILVERGDSAVLHSTARNLGAEFSDTGLGNLIERAEGDDDLMTLVGLRPHVPRHHFLALLSKASGDVRARLQAAHPHARTEIAGVINDVTRRARETTAAESPEVITAQRTVKALQDAGQLNEASVAEFARSEKFNEVSTAIALLIDAPHATIEAMMVDAHSEGIIAVAKILRFSWPTVKAILDLRSRCSGSAPDVEFTRLSYERLKPDTAQQVLHLQKRRRA